ncbi:gnat family acetyltransferase [Roseibium sp. TrichSKD4]|uniref:GNAT family N-acetyltransferase n=1 Tax=Roseibium sp. TrichSKD4 TaxID=744980 RepID=UPI0001E562A8|nr:GNAT family N-acetyltransferase [Roseibium sp. TrichSKD4]EFO33828.1 gnat family acetyltransferase [Roseibium sp. TrichSKD4]
MPFTVNRANSIDCYEIAALLRRSIIELCTADHDGDPEKYEPWIANKTPDWVEKWIEGQGRVVAARDMQKVIGVAMASPDGEVLLNYVLPEARFTGVSKAMMRALEDYVRDNGRSEIRLKSTVTAARFYRSLGYVESDDKLTGMDVDGLWLKKALN